MAGDVMGIYTHLSLSCS